MLLKKFPRVRFGHLPTPLEPMERLSKALGGPELWIKRDDCTGMSTGGNKTRKLEFLFGEALQNNAEIVLTQGATQSNHARQTAAFAAKLGMKCHLLLEDRVGSDQDEYYRNGNVFLDYLHGATIESRPSGLDMNTELEAVAEQFRNKGNNVYVIPGGGSNPTGALGYVNCISECIDQCAQHNVAFDHVVHATGSSGTQAGLAVGLQLHASPAQLLGIGVRAAQEKQEQMVFDLADRTAAFIGKPGIVRPEDIRANCDYVGQGYGKPTEASIEAIRLFAQYEGILLDPVYSGKGAAGLIDLIRTKAFGKQEKVLFVHTGGSASLFSYTYDFGYQTKASLQN